MVRAGGRGGRRGDRDGGYNLVALMVAVTVMNSLVAVALPAWSHIVQRDREKELVFRGLQYAEAIRVFQQRQGRPPVRLDELLEVTPRAIRQLWKNPLGDDAGWTPIYQNQPGGGDGSDLGGGAGDGGAGGDGRDGDANPPGGRDRGGRGAAAQQRRGPIVGVVSSTGGEAILDWNGSRSISEWRFEVDVLTRGLANEAYNAGHIGAVNLGQHLRPMNADDLGRPFPPGVVPPVLQNQPAGGGGGGGGVAGGASPPKNRPSGAAPGGGSRPRPGDGGDGQRR